MASYRRVARTAEEGREQDLYFEMQAAPWSDQHLELLLQADPRSVTLLRQYVYNAAEHKNWPEAQRRADMFAARAPRSPSSWLCRIEALYWSGRGEESVALLRKAVRRMPREHVILLEWAREAVRRKDWTEALRRYDRVRRHAPESIEGYTEAANVLMEADRRVAADERLAEGMQRLPEAWIIWEFSARLVERAGDLDEAIHRWEQLRTQFPSHSTGFLGGAEALARAGRDEEAAALIRQARDYFPADKRIAEAVTRLAPMVEPTPPAADAP
jgi:predicted Zn-dependent protease